MIAGVDIGGTKIAVGIVTGDGRLLARRDGPTGAGGPYSEALERTVAMLRAIAVETGQSISGIGVGSTGPVDPFTGEIGDVNFFPHWRGENPVRDLGQALGVSVAIENDADAAALGEAAWGAGRGKKRLLYVTVGTGIGVALLVDGAVYRGVDQAHPEIGHHVVDASGPPCSCGFSGCWESLAAGPAMVSWIERNAPQDYLYRAGLTAKQICELARQGDWWARRAVAHEGRYLGLGLANLVTLFAPDGLVLSGGVMKSADLFLETIRSTIRSGCRFVPHEKSELSLASLGDDANLIGAARVWCHRFAPQGASRG